MTSLLTPDFGLLFWMVISFLIVFGVLAKFGFPIITRSVRERKEYIDKSLEAADEANRKLDKIKEETERLMSEASARQSEILKNAVSEGEKVVENAKQRAMEEAEKIVEAANRRIEIQKKKALSELNTQAAIISVDIAEKILRNKLSDRQTQEDLAMRLLQEAENIPVGGDSKEA